MNSMEGMGWDLKPRFDGLIGETSLSYFYKLELITLG
jgi:hypothetical protein